MIRAKFIGKDGSMGFRTGCYYWVRIKEDYDKHWLWVRELFGLYCPYTSTKTLEENWEIKHKQGKFKPIKQYGRF